MSQFEERRVNGPAILGWLAKSRSGSVKFTYETKEAQCFQKDGDDLIAVVTSNQLAASEIQREELQKRIDVLMLENATLKAKLQVQA